MILFIKLQSNELSNNLLIIYSKYKNVCVGGSHLETRIWLRQIYIKLAEYANCMIRIRS